MAVFRVPKHKDFTVMSNHHLRNKTLSLKAKGLLSLMLSLPEDWDYTLEGLTHICKDGRSSIRGAIVELEEQGYLRRRRMRNEKGQLTDTEYTILEEPVPPDSVCDLPDTESAEPPMCENRTQAASPMCDFPTLGLPTQEKPTLENRTQLNIQDKSNTHESNIHPINPSDSMDWMDGATAWQDLIKTNIEYEVLSDRYGQDRLDEIVELMLEVMLSQRKYIRIAGDDFPKEAVRSRLLKLDYSHVEYVFDSLDKNTTKIRNIKAYLLTALYNAPTTMGSYYRSEVNHDLYGKG